MNCIHLLCELNIDIRHLDEKKQQTQYKIKYIVEYIKLWLIVNVNRKEISVLNFVDCMCNAGLYQDGDLCTSMEVLLLFINAATLNPDKQFNLLINDIDKKRITIWKNVAERLMINKKPENLFIIPSTLDVNDYLQDYSLFDQYFKYGGVSVLFVDPYDFGTVIIDRLTNLVKRYYCEVIFNFFISDYVRNRIDARIRKCIGDVEITDKEKLISYIVSSIKTGKIKHVFSYQFRTSTNTELYQIIFATPHIKGLEVLKDALWETFNGKFFHRNFEDSSGQQTFLTGYDDRQVLLSVHASAARDLLLRNFAGQTVMYKHIELFLVENTMMRKTDFLRSVLKPLIENRLVIKNGKTTNKSNYRDDEYTFINGTCI